MLRIEMLTIFYPPCSKRRWFIAARTLGAEAVGRRLIVWKIPTAAGTFGGDPALQDHQRLKVRREQQLNSSAAAVFLLHPSVCAATKLFPRQLGQARNFGCNKKLRSH